MTCHVKINVGNNKPLVFEFDPCNIKTPFTINHVLDDRVTTTDVYVETYGDCNKNPNTVWAYEVHTDIKCTTGMLTAPNYYEANKKLMECYAAELIEFVQLCKYNPEDGVVKLESHPIESE